MMRLDRAIGDQIGRYLVPWKEAAWPIDWAAAFGRRAPLHVEIGFGNGEFLQREAAARPDVDWIGIDIAWARARRLINRLDRAGTRNARVLLADAWPAFEFLFAPGSIAEVTAWFPDPWSKKAQRRRRLFQPAFVALVESRLAPGGVLRVATDVASYADAIESALAGRPGLASRGAAARGAAIPGRDPSKYERKALRAGAAVHYFEWARRADSAVAAARAWEVEEVPNVTLDGCRDPARLLEGLPLPTWKEEHDGEDVLVRFVDLYRHPSRDRWLVETLVHDGRLVQHLALAVVPQASGTVTVKFSPIGLPRPTWGTKRAVWRLAGLLLERDPSLRVTSTTVGPLGEMESGTG